MELLTIPLGAEGEMAYIPEVKATNTQPFVHSESFSEECPPQARTVVLQVKISDLSH